MRLEHGRAIVTLKLEEGAVPVYRDASVLLRPKTGLKDMVAELTPGTPAAGELPEDERIPIGQTLPDVNLDEILAALDGDTRAYLVMLLSGGARGPARQQHASWRTRSAASSRSRATRARSPSSSRRGRRNIRGRSTTSRCSPRRSATRTRRSASSSRTPTRSSPSLADQDASLRATLQELPPALDATTRRADQRRRDGDGARPDARGAAARPPARSARRWSRRGRS